jgi:hypothetical protein
VRLTLKTKSYFQWRLNSGQQQFLPRWTHLSHPRELYLHACIHGKHWQLQWKQNFQTCKLTNDLNQLSMGASKEILSILVKHRTRLKHIGGVSTPRFKLIAWAATTVPSNLRTRALATTSPAVKTRKGVKIQKTPFLVATTCRNTLGIRVVVYLNGTRTTRVSLRTCLNWLTKMMTTRRKTRETWLRKFK